MSEVDALRYSVVLPCHDAARTLARALVHLGRLRPPPVEILVVDDASTDGSGAIAEATPGVRALRLGERRGQAHARNVGVGATSAPWLLCVDTDCYVDAAGFARAIRFLAGARGTVAGVMAVFGRESPPGPFGGVYKNYFRHLEIAAMRNPPPVFNSSCFLVRRDAFLAVGGFDERFAAMPTEDNEFYFRLVRHGFTLPYLVDFSFAHDKPMRLGQLFRDDARRAAAIVLNLRGRLGEPGRGWSGSEKLRWTVEVMTGNASAALPAGLALWALGIPGARGLTLAGAAGAGVLALLLRDKLRQAYAERGAAFAGRLYLYRAVEMVAAAVGIVWGLAGGGGPDRL